MLAQYHRWIFEKKKDESAISLRAWILQESEFITIAPETVHGLTGKMAKNASAQSAVRYGNQRTFSEKQRIVEACRHCFARNAGNSMVYGTVESSFGGVLQIGGI